MRRVAELVLPIRSLSLGRVPTDEALLVANMHTCPAHPSPELAEGVLEILERWLYVLYPPVEPDPA